MNWKEIIKAETLQSVAKDMEKLFRATDWRTVMRSELVNLDERIEGMSKEEIEDLRRFNAGLNTPQRQEYTGMVDKLLELKGKDIVKEDRSNNNIWVEYTFNGETKTIGPFKFPELSKHLDSVPTQSTKITIIEKQFTKDGKYLGTKIMEQPSPHRRRF